MVGLAEEYYCSSLPTLASNLRNVLYNVSLNLINDS